MSRYDLTELEWRFIQHRLSLARLARALRPLPTVYNRFRRWTEAGVWGRIMDAAVDAHNGDVVIDGTSVRVHHARATLKKTIPDDAWGVRAVV